MTLGRGKTKLVSNAALIWSLFSLTIVACWSSVGVELTAVHTPVSTLSEQPTITMISTSSPSSTPTNTPFPATPLSQATPDVFHQPIADRLLFTDVEQCPLPCWYGLRVGESTSNEIPSAFRQALDLPETYVFGQYVIPRNVNHTAITGGWVIEDETYPEGAAGVGITAIIDSQTNILSTLDLNWFGLENYSATPQRIMRFLGLPANIWAELYPPNRADVALITTQFYYPELDMGITLRASVPVRFSQQNTIRTANWCLNGGAGYQEFSVHVLFVEPTERVTAESHLSPIERVFGITPENLYERAIQEDNPCVGIQF